MNRVVAALCCMLLGCTTTMWSSPVRRDLGPGSEVFVVESDRAFQLRNARSSGDRVEGEIVHAWRLPPGPMHVEVRSDDEPADIARRGGWQEDVAAPAVYVGGVENVDRVRETHDSHLGRFLLGGLAFCALSVAVVLYGFRHIGPAD